MESKDKIEIALRAGMLANDILGLMKINSKDLSQMILNKAMKDMIDLDDKIKSLPSD